MKPTLGWSVWLLALLMIPLGTGAGQAAALGSADRPLHMMFVPSGEAQVILQGGEDIARLLKKFTGLHFKTSIATSYAAVIEAMGAGKVDIGWLATFAYVLAREKYDVDLLLIVVRFGSPFYRGQIVVRADSGITTLEDLQGKRFAYVDPVSTSGHLYPKTLLMAKGLDPDRLFKHAVFAGSHNAVILSIMKGEVDAGATYDDARAAIAKDFPEVYDQVRVIAHTKEIPNDTVTARKNLDPELKKRIKEGLQYLAKTPEGSRLLKRLYGISGLMDFDAFFDPVRQARRLLKLAPDSLKSRKAP